MDSGNILSILASLGDNQPAPAQANVLQSAAPPPVNVDQGSIAPQQQPIDPGAVAQAAVAASPPMPQPRRSLLDTIGRISDVLAQVGGATPLYQPSVDAQAARITAQGDHARAVDMNNVDLATKQQALTTAQTAAADSERSRFASVLDGVKDANDAANLPQMMAAAGLTDPKYAPFIKMVQDNPETAKTLSGALGGEDKVKYGGNIVNGKDANGNLHAYQPNLTGGDARDVLPAGITPVDPLQFVNTGGSQVGVGKLSGTPKTILPNSVSPNVAANNQTSRANNQTTNQTQLTIAGMPARAPATPKGAANGYTSYVEARSGLAALSDSLDKIINDQAALAAGTGLRGAIEQHIPGTAAQRLLGNIETTRGKALVGAINNLKALSANGSLGFRMTQQEANAFSASMAGALQNTKQTPADYAANLRGAQARIAQMVTQLDEDATAKGYIGQKASGPNPAALAEARRRRLIR